MIRKAVIIVLTVAATGLTGVWIASCTVVGRGFEDYDDVHGVTYTWYRDASGSLWGWGASDAESKWGSFFILSSTRLEASAVVNERFSDFAGFGWSHLVMRRGGNRFLNRSVYMPPWAPITLFAAYPISALIRGPFRRWRRRRKGLCSHCGYNLTGNVSGVCPECGERILLIQAADDPSGGGLT